MQPAQPGLTASEIFVRSLLALLVVASCVLAGIYWHIYHYDKLFGDFHTFRSAALHIASGDKAGVYDLETVKRLFADHTLKAFDFFLNPPTGLFLVYPLAFLSELPGIILWTGMQYALLWLVLRGEYIRRLLAPASARAVSTNGMLLILFAAFSLQNMLYGQVAVLCSALFLAVLALRETRPVAAGILLGIFCFKPQLGLMLPLLLLAEGRWKVLIVAALTAALLAAASYLLWGAALWQDYSEMMTIRSRFMAGDPDLLFVISISVYAGLRNLGLSADLALGFQAAVGLLAIILAWRVFRKGGESHKILMLIFATYLVTPYSLLYDMTLLAIPCAWFFRRAEANVATRQELILLLFLVLMPVVTVLVQILHFPYSVIAIGLGLVVAKMLALNERHG